MIFCSKEFWDLWHRTRKIEQTLGKPRETVTKYNDSTFSKINEIYEIQPTGIFERLEKLEKAILKKEEKEMNDTCSNCGGYIGINRAGMMLALASEGKQLRDCLCRSNSHGRIDAKENKFEHGSQTVSEMVCPQCLARLEIRKKEK